MGEETQRWEPFDKLGRERYMLIHKHPVGPKTAERLFLLYEYYSQTQHPQSMYKAGWMALEAGLVGTHLSSSDRSMLVECADDCWQYAIHLQNERSANKAWQNTTIPNNEQAYRFETALASIPVFKDFVVGKPTRKSSETNHNELLRVTQNTYTDLKLARKYKLEGYTANYRGLLFEQLAVLPITRKKSTRFTAATSIARCDSGANYSDQTHDAQYLYLHGSEIVNVVPLEVKTHLRNKFFKRYTGVGLLDGSNITDNNPGRLLNCLVREADGRASERDMELLEDLTSSVIHSIRHYSHPERAGIHCREPNTCTLGAVALKAS